DPLPLCRLLVESDRMSPHCLELVRWIYLYFVRMALDSCPILCPSVKHSLQDLALNHHLPSVIIKKTCPLLRLFEPTVTCLGTCTPFPHELCCLVEEYADAHHSEIATHIDSFA